MNKRLILTVAVMFYPFALLASEQPSLEQQAMKKIKAFASELKTTLTANVKQGGLVQGINVCKNAANAIAKKHSTDGWMLKRTSLKLRNTNNKPDSWEQKQLAYFQQALSRGTKITDLVVQEQVERDNAKQFRLMKAIPTGQLCLNCHGEHIADNVREILQQHYPDDRATGFKLGELRGAFSITKTIDGSELQNHQH